MPKLIDKVKEKFASRVLPVLDEIGKQLYNRLNVVVNCMNIDVKSIFESTTDYNSFWELVNKYYNDYVDMEDYEDASN